MIIWLTVTVFSWKWLNQNLAKENLTEVKGSRVVGFFGGSKEGPQTAFLGSLKKVTRKPCLVLRECIRSGTTIVSDCWKSYGTLQDKGFTHLTVNHSLHFKDPGTGASTEGSWSTIKRKKFLIELLIWTLICIYTNITLGES